MVDIVLGSRWAAGPANATYNLGKCGIEALHYYAQDTVYNRYNMNNLPDGARSAWLDQAWALYTGLNEHEKVAVRSFLLSRRDPASNWRRPNILAVGGAVDAATAAGMPAGSNARRVLDQAHGAYVALTDKQKAQVDAYLVDQHGLTKAQRVHGSEAYRGLNLVDKARVNLYQPGSKEYEELYKHRHNNPEAWKIVRGRIKTQESIRDATRSLLIASSQFCKNVPVPLLGNFIGDWIEKRVESHYPDFDPDRREKDIEIKKGTEAARKIEWEVEQITQGAQGRFQELLDGTRPDPVTGDEAPYRNLGADLADDLIAQEVRRLLLNTESDMGNLVFQMQHSIQKMYSACHDFKKNLHKHMMEIIGTGKNEKTIYKEALATFHGKMMSEAWECEPIIMGGRFANGSVF